MNKNTISYAVLFSAIVFASFWNPRAALAQFPIYADQKASTWIGFSFGASIASESVKIPVSTDGDNSATSGFKLGLALGPKIEHWFGDNWGISSGVFLLQKGVDEQYPTSSAARGVDTSGNDNFSLNYIEVPILLKWAFGYGEIRPFVFAGPSFGFLLSASESTDGTIPPINNLKSYLNTVDYSVVFGAGVMERIFKGPAITFDAEYETGFAKVFSSEPPRPFSQPIGQTSATSSEIIITIGAMWGI
jgi:hypothetical protein